jgi:aryl-phospho-beta-D-glucosidase BglC (GH1 family)
MDWAVDQALSNQLMVILDFHDDLEISPDPEGKRKDFLAAWTAIAQHCKNHPGTVLFEILNEPAAKFTSESWDEYCGGTHPRRTHNKEVTSPSLPPA